MADSLRSVHAALAAWRADSLRVVLAALAGFASWEAGEPYAGALAERGTTGRYPRVLDFSQQQQLHRRVLEARLQKQEQLKALFQTRGLRYPAAELFVRIFKRERVLELWARPAEQDRFTLVKSYPICALASQFGPKRVQGDGQTPEGVYAIDGFNPASDFFLSLHLDYPNKSDRILSHGVKLGGDIYIHGGCRTEGCLAVTDDAIKELYWLAVEARTSGQQRIPVHIFPTRMTDHELNQMARVFDPRAQLRGFWANLRPLYDYFEKHRRLPLITIDDYGRYRLMPQLGKPAGE
jgi:murein L,D-transpeptidase YafK